MKKVRFSARVTKISRDTIMFSAGILGFAHETLIEHSDRPNLLLACLALVGLPPFLPKRNDKDDL